MPISTRQGDVVLFKASRGVRIERVYDAAGAALSAEGRQAMEASRKVNRQHKYGKHKYSLADFGLTKGDVEPRIAAYRERFDVPYE